MPGPAKDKGQFWFRWHSASLKYTHTFPLRPWLSHFKE